MDESTIHFATVFMAFFAIMNPIANAPTFVGLTNGLSQRDRTSIAWRSVVLAFAIVAVFAVFGRTIFSLFGITLPAFRIAGGALVGLVGYQLLQGQQSSVHNPSAEDNAESREAILGIAITPLALPILGGPGTIATAMNYSAESTPQQLFIVLLALGLVSALNFAAFMAGGQLVRVLGQNAIKVVSRLMGLILAVIGVQMLITGIRGAISLPL
jgi:multiple antibiotic resistance protein